MRRWFSRLPIHRKLIVLALTVTTAALTVAIAGLIAVAVWRDQVAAAADTAALADVMAENMAAAVLFEDPRAATQTLTTLRVQPTVRRACLYLPDGRLFASFARTPELACGPDIVGPDRWAIVAGTASVRQNDRTLGTVYVERDIGDIGASVAVAVGAGVLMLLLAAAFAAAIASRLTRTVSGPIAQLAATARTVQPDAPRAVLPVSTEGQDEVGELVRAFSDMLGRIQEANDALRRKEAEREELLTREREASRLKDEFLAAVSHELRTPLNAIMGWIQILATSTSNEQMVSRAVASIARNARAQTRVIEDLVDVSRIVTGKLALRFTPVDLREPVEAALDVTRPAAQARRISLETYLPSAACMVTGDRDRLQQIIWNLLSNAVKFTPANGSVIVSLRRLGSEYQIEVRDTGAGIAPAFLPYVFDRFRQADGSLVREHGGLGLGLAIVKDITALHGGSVDAASGGLGRGSTFTVHFPALAGARPAGPSGEGDERDADGALSGLRVLAVDDNADALDVLSVSLESAGAVVRTALSGGQALTEWQREPADILLCDLAMPEMNGYEVLDRVREMDKAAGRVTHAVAISAHATEQHVARSLSAGFARHLAKPFRIHDLVRVLQEAMANS